MQLRPYKGLVGCIDLLAKTWWWFHRSWWRPSASWARTPPGMGMYSTRDLGWSMSSLLHGEGPQLRDFPLQSWQVVGFWILHLVFHQEPEIFNFNFHFPLLLPIWYWTTRMRSLLYHPRQKVFIRMQRNFLCNIPRHIAKQRKKPQGAVTHRGDAIMTNTGLNFGDGHCRILCKTRERTRISYTNTCISRAITYKGAKPCQLLLNLNLLRTFLSLCIAPAH